MKNHATMNASSKMALAVVARTVDPLSQSNGSGTPQLNRADAERFLAALDPNAARWTFQIFDDNRERESANKAKWLKAENERLQRAKAKGIELKKKPYYSPFAKIFHGSLDEHWEALCTWNEQGCGIFITVNETDFKGRSKKNIARVRALFADLDGAPLDAVLADKILPPPQIIIESSPQHWHTYFLVHSLELAKFEIAQKVLAVRFNADPAVHDLPRVLRLPGFFHRKDKDNPYLVKSTRSMMACHMRAMIFLRSWPRPRQKQMLTPAQLQMLGLSKNQNKKQKPRPIAKKINIGRSTTRLYKI